MEVKSSTVVSRDHSTIFLDQALGARTDFRQLVSTLRNGVQAHAFE
jgi:hypothetical protein